MFMEMIAKERTAVVDRKAEPSMRETSSMKAKAGEGTSNKGI